MIKFNCLQGYDGPSDYVTPEFNSLAACRLIRERIVCAHSEKMAMRNNPGWIALRLHTQT